VISHAVTKGLNPDAPMKDSGVEWLGEVPEHWVVAKLRYLVSESAAGPYGAALTKAMYTDSGCRVYGQQQVIAGSFEVGDYYISREKYEEMARYTVSPGDLLITVMGTIGRVAVVPDGVEKGIINPRLVRYVFDKKRLTPEFAKEQILSSLHQEYLLQTAQGSTMDGLNMGILGGLPLAYPPHSEQLEILNYVNTISSKYSSLIVTSEKSLELLRERRTALISAAVTGKIDVRNWQPSQAEILMEASA
jgi:type I restriction enzyme S subunit